MIYAVCEDTQADTILEKCFRSCGKIRPAALVILGRHWWPCKEAMCPYLDCEVQYGEHAGEPVCLRRLK